MNKVNDPTRESNCFLGDNGNPYFKSSPSPKSIKVRAECKHPIHHPGIILFVHGVNSTGEWYSTAERNICEGLNERLGLKSTSFELIPNKYNCDNIFDLEGYKLDRVLLNAGEANSPVVRFYWGYRAVDGEEGTYEIPLVNKNNEDYHLLKEKGLKLEELRGKGPWFWGGGPFQNGTNNLVSLWSDVGFNERMRYLGLEVQDFAPDFDRLLKTAPPRKYYAHAAKRLADLMDSIRDEFPRDTVSVISHSQGTMIALAATSLAKKAPDSLFILNSPYAMEPKLTDKFSTQDKEIITDTAREQTLEAIINKIAERSNFLQSDKYNELFVGKSSDNQPWTPDISHTSISGRQISERDNHGRLYIYCNPHDRVMGSSPLLSLGWQGLPNNGLEQQPHKLITAHEGHLFQRIMARSTSCGAAPNSKTPFWSLPDGKPFWDDGGNYPTYFTPKYQTININSEEVPDPILSDEMIGFDMKRPGDGSEWDEKPMSHKGKGWGQFSEKNDEDNKSFVVPNDDTFNNFVVLYPKKQVPTGAYQPSGKAFPQFEPVMRLETDEERRIRVGAYISQPTDHSTLPNSPEFMRRVVTYDLPIGFCDATWDKNFMAKLRDMADWTKGYDTYFETGQLNIPPLPAEIFTETISDVELEKRKAEWYEINTKLNSRTSIKSG